MIPIARPGCPYYIHAPLRLDDGDPVTTQLHLLCHLLNQAGCPAFLVEAPMVCGAWWTPLLSSSVMASHHVAGRIPISVRVNGQVSDEPDPGLSVVFVSEFLSSQGMAPGEFHFRAPGMIPGMLLDHKISVALPWFDPILLAARQEHPESGRSGGLVFSGQLPSTAFKIRPEHEHLRDISARADEPLSNEARHGTLESAHTLFAYAKGVVTTEARLLGTKVVYVANDHQLQKMPSNPLDTWGTWRDSDNSPMSDLAFDRHEYRAFLERRFSGIQESLQRFIESTQAAACNIPVELAWAPAQLQRLDSWIPASAQVRSERADAQARERLAKDYQLWSRKASPTEIYGDICAEVVNAGLAQAPVVHLYAHGRSMAELADALDQVSSSWLPPVHVVVHAPFPPPVPIHELGDNLYWCEGTGVCGDVCTGTLPPSAEWIVLMEAGYRPEPYALIELMAAAQGTLDAVLIYAAEDVPVDGKLIPHFKGGSNLEWLRGCNFLGGLVAVRFSAWDSMADKGFFSSAYRIALRATAHKGTKALHYVDKVLAHAPSTLASGQESAEFNTASQEITALWPGTRLEPSDTLGCWNVHYPCLPHPVSLVVPTGHQLGYLRSLLLSVERLAGDAVHEIVLVAPSEKLAAVQGMIKEWDSKIQFWNIVDGGDKPYNHAFSLNLGVRAARFDLVMVCDDDIELLDQNAIERLRAFFVQPNIAAAGPRQVLQVGNKPCLVAGPQIPGESARLLNYVGEQQWMSEKGLFNRLQMTQDVAGLNGSCLMLRKSAFEAVGGCDEQNAPLFNAVTDLGYRFLEAGWRMVWSPLATVLHAGSKTLLSMRRDTVRALAMTEQQVRESQYLLTRWTSMAANNGLYSRHFSAHRPYVLDSVLVNHWSPQIRRRPRVLAQPISSGSGQYRVIEPLDALQLRSLAETCVVAPPERNQPRRILTPLDVARFQPDRIVVQHSIADEDIANLRAIRQANPKAFIVQLMDDLTSELPPSHPNYVFGQREGHVRTLEALALSDRLLVSTQPLADYYAAHCKDIRLVPNSLEETAWGGHFRIPSERSRLRVGWAGAAQHLGDLRLIKEVVACLAKDVDWIFMGMCPDELRPFIKEFHSFVSYKHYPAKLAALDLDIALAPLENNPFNASKSNLRLLEYGAMGWPTICSDVYPFQTSSPPVIRLSNDADLWIQEIQKLMLDRNLRLQLGQALNDWLREHYFLNKHVSAWYHAIFD